MILHSLIFNWSIIFCPGYESAEATASPVTKPKPTMNMEPKTEDEDYQVVRHSDSNELASHHFDLHGPLKQQNTAPAHEHERGVSKRFRKEARELPGLPGPTGPPGSRGKNIKLTVVDTEENNEIKKRHVCSKSYCDDRNYCKI